MKNARVAILLALALAACTPRAPRPQVLKESDLAGTAWVLTDLNGAGVPAGVPATLLFLGPDRIGGNSSCNRFTGPFRVETAGLPLRIGPLAATRKGCPPAVMEQELKYLYSLESAERLAFEGSDLLLYSKGIPKPLRFARDRTAD